VKPLALVLGLGAVGALFLWARRSSSSSSSELPTGAIDPTGEGTWVVAPVAPPAGFRRVLGSEVTPELTAQAKRVLSEHGRDPIGTADAFTVGGKAYLGIIEQHYHPPGGPLKPWGPHHGVSLFVEVVA
jgi:hypothetical protein